MSPPLVESDAAATRTSSGTHPSGRFASFGKDTLVVTLATAATLLSGFVLIPIITKSLGAAAYGAFVDLQTTTDLAIALTLLALPFAMVRYLPGSADEPRLPSILNGVALAVLACSVAVSILLVAAARPLAAGIFDGDRRLVWLAAVALPLQSLTQVYLSYFRTVRRFAAYAVASTLITFGRVAAITGAVATGASIVGVVVATILMQAASLAVLAAVVGSVAGWSWPCLDTLPRYLRFSLPMLPTNLAGWVVSLSDRYVLAVFLGTSAVGAYNPAYLIGAIPQLLMVPLDFVAISAISHAHNSGDTKLTQDMITKPLALFLTLAIPASVGAVLVGPAVLTLMTTREIASQGVAILPWVAAGAVLFGVASLAPIRVLFLHEQTHEIMVSWLLAAAVNLGLNLVLVPRLGILGAGVSTTLAFGVTLAVSEALARRRARYAFPAAAAVRAAAASAAMGGVVWLLKPSALASAVGAVAVGILVYTAFLAVFGGFSRGGLAALGLVSDEGV